MARSYEATELDRIELGDRVVAHLEQQAVDTRFAQIVEAAGLVAVETLIAKDQAA
jgi:hypothetical protein